MAVAGDAGGARQAADCKDVAWLVRKQERDAFVAALNLEVHLGTDAGIARIEPAIVAMKQQS